MANLTLSPQRVQRALHPFAPAIQDVGVDHGRGHVRMTQKLLHGADVITRHQQVGPG